MDKFVVKGIDLAVGRLLIVLVYEVCNLDISGTEKARSENIIITPINQADINPGPANFEVLGILTYFIIA